MPSVVDNEPTGLASLPHGLRLIENEAVCRPPPRLLKPVTPVVYRPAVTAGNGGRSMYTLRSLAGRKPPRWRSLLPRLLM